MPSRQGFRAPGPDAPGPAEREENVVQLARQAVERLSARLPGVQVYCHMRVGDALRVVASVGGLRLIYEVPREQGGICWRAAESGKPQLVEDVRHDPDYLATDERVRSEVAYPVLGGDETLLVLDADFTERTFTPEEAEAVEAEAARLASELD
jgi:putative methionine-R-sulfoxide reductase with GAF domain